jgi:hypothetical protein
VIVAPPSLVGAVKETEADVAPVTVAVPIVGAEGAEGVKVVAANDDSDAIDEPTEFVAMTRNL